MQLLKEILYCINELLLFLTPQHKKLIAIERLLASRGKFINLSNITYKRDKINAITKRDPILYK